MQRLALLACASLTCLATEARAQALDTLSGIASDLSFVEQQVTKTLNSLGSPTSGYPVSGGQSGTWTTYSPSDNAEGWASGFFPGELWLLYQATGSTYWLNEAQTWTTPLASQASNTSRVDPTDIGFIIGTSFGNGYRLTGDPSYQSVLLTAGSSLSTLYNPTVGAVRSWTFPPYQPPNNFAVIIDSMMTLGPLQWGASQPGGSASWATIASTHATTVTNNLVRSNGSTFEVANFNPTTGALMSRGTFAGYSDSSTWARGEAWALYGFVQAYQATDNPAFLSTAEEIANYFVNNLPTTGPSAYIPPWDFNAPGTQPVDTSAAAIAADGLVMLSTVAGSMSASYLTDAENILGALGSYFDTAPNGEAVLLDGYTGTTSGESTSLIYGDYYFTEALLRLQDVLDGQPGWVLYSPAAAPVVPETSTWAMMLLGFAGLGLAGYRASRKAVSVARG
jgi:unsaturated chondroitin disaccharide hydrolase